MSNFFKNIHPLLRRSRSENKYDDTNFAVLNSLNYELTQAEQETIASKIQSSLETATDTYLDTWGDWFGVYRKDGWDDEFYRKRIIRELLLKRGTVPAIIEALVDFLDDNDATIQIYEPWRNIFYTNKSKLNGEDCMMGYYYRFAIIDISIDRPFPPEIVETIKAFKPAGVLFYIRLDTSLSKNKTVVESPYVYLDVTNKEELEFFNGLSYDIRGNINLTNQRGDVIEDNIFHTNNSKLNGKDVLAGSFSHNRQYIHLASTTSVDYKPANTDTLSSIKTTIGEAAQDIYNQTATKDGNSATITIPSTESTRLYTAFDIKTFIDENYKEEFKFISAKTNEEQALNDLFTNFIISTSLKALVSPSSPIKLAIELYDFKQGSWHTLKTEDIVLYSKTVEVYANHITDYLNDNSLLVIRHTFSNTSNKTTIVELDSLNVLFNYRMGSGYSIGLQSSVSCLNEIPVKSISLNKSAVELGINEQETLTASITPQIATNKDLEWVSENPNVADVTDKGIITTKSLGSTTVTAYADERRVSTKCTVSAKNRYNLYANNKEFGDYDYSGNPNLMRTIQASDFTVENDTTVSDVEYNSIRLTSQGTNRLSTYTKNNTPSLVSGKTYTISAKVKIEDGTTGNIDKLRVSYRKANGGTILLSAITTGVEIGKEITIKSTAVVNYEITDLAKFYLTIDTESSAKINGSVIVRDIKIEEGSTATPYQPNLLDAPYYLGNTPLGANIANPKQVFPINTTDYYVYGGTNTDNYVAGQYYTLSMAATKPPTQTFSVYVDNGFTSVGNMEPVQGLTDVWALTFQITKEHIDKGVANMIQIYQTPKDTMGACSVTWLKLEKGANRTPNISKYAYKGTVLTTSNTAPVNPKEYTWTTAD